MPCLRAKSRTATKVEWMGASSSRRHNSAGRKQPERCDETGRAELDGNQIVQMPWRNAAMRLFGHIRRRKIPKRERAQCA